jgi:hypothetical protein
VLKPHTESTSSLLSNAPQVDSSKLLLPYINITITKCTTFKATETEEKKWKKG